MLKTKAKRTAILFMSLLFIGSFFTSCEKNNDFSDIESEYVGDEVQLREGLCFEIVQLESTDECCVFIATLDDVSDLTGLSLITGNPDISITLLPSSIFDPFRWRIEYCPNENPVIDPFGGTFGTAPISNADLALIYNEDGNSYIFCERDLECNLNSTPCPMLVLSNIRYFDEDQPEFIDCYAADFQIQGTPPVGCEYELRVGPTGGAKNGVNGGGEVRFCPGDIVEVWLVCGDEIHLMCEYEEQ